MTASSSYLKPHTLLLTLAGTSSLSDLRQERDFYIHSLYSPSLESIYGKLIFLKVLLSTIFEDLFTSKYGTQKCEEFLISFVRKFVDVQIQDLVPAPVRAARLPFYRLAPARPAVVHEDVERVSEVLREGLAALARREVRGRYFDIAARAFPDARRRLLQRPGAPPSIPLLVLGPLPRPPPPTPQP